MLRTLSPSEKPKQEFVVIDIENSDDGSGRVVSISTCWRGGYHVHPSWQEWWPWYVGMAKKDKKFRTVWAHNGGGWDWLSLLQWLITTGRADHEGISIVAPSSKIVVARVSIDGEFQIVLTDSYEILRSSLDNLGRKFCGQGKIDLGGRLPGEVAKTDPELFSRYCRQDCEILLTVLEKTLYLIRERIAKIDKLSNTIGGTALRVWRTLGLAHPIVLPWDPFLKDLLRCGLVGGRNESFAGKAVWKNVHVYDVNSMYASIMKNCRVPITNRVCKVEGRQLREAEIGVYRVRFVQQNRDIPAVLLLQDRGDGKNGKGVYEGEGVYYSPELHLLRQVDPDAIIEILWGYSFLDRSVIFGPYAEKLYALRMEDRDGPVGAICKELLCALWGKFSQKATAEKLIAVRGMADLMDRVRSGSKIRPMNHPAFLDDKYDFAKGPRQDNERIIPVYSVTENITIQHEHVGISGVIASEARVALYRVMRISGLDRLLYVDTDSVHVIGPLPADLIDQNQLGKWKLVHENCEAVYLSDKFYALRWPGGEKVAHKGVSCVGLDEELTFARIEKMVLKGGGNVKFAASATARQVLTGRADACTFKTRGNCMKANS